MTYKATKMKFTEEVGHWTAWSDPYNVEQNRVAGKPGMRERIERKLFPSDKGEVSTREWMWIIPFIFIPYVNIAAIVYFATTKKAKPSIRCFFKASLWWLLIIAIYYLIEALATGRPLF